MRCKTKAAVAAILFTGLLGAGHAMEPGTASGTFTVNDEAVTFTHAYFYPEPEGFYNPEDPTWTVLFATEPVAAREVEDPFLDPALRIGVTLTSEFDDEPTLHVLSQSIRRGSASMSGGTYPELDLEQQGPDAFSGRIHLPEPITFFDDKFVYDLRFNASLADPNAPIGDPLPEGGGEPGKAYVAFVNALHSGDIATMKKMVPPEMAAELDGPDAAEGLEFMALLTPKDVRVLGGSSDGQIAILEIEGTMEGQSVSGEVTMEREGDIWIETKSSVQ